MAFTTEFPTPSLLLLVFVAVSAACASARELRPSDHGLEFQYDPSSQTSDPKPPPGMLSFFGTSMSPPSPESSNRGIPKEVDSSDASLSNGTGKHDRVRDALLVVSLACGATGVALLIASGMLFLFKYRKERIRSACDGASTIMQPSPPTKK